MGGRHSKGKMKKAYEKTNICLHPEVHNIYQKIAGIPFLPYASFTGCGIIKCGDRSSIT
jgi:hypothetical protein